MTHGDNEQIRCPIDLVLHIIGAKWTIPIVRELLDGAKRPSQLSKALKGINPKTLTDRLRDLEKWELVERRAFQEIPPRVEYSLTNKGRELISVMEALRKLGESWQGSLKLVRADRRSRGDGGADGDGAADEDFEYLESDQAIGYAEADHQGRSGQKSND